MDGLLLVDAAASFVARLTLLLMRLTLAGAVIVGGVFVGHELREWREWYWALPPAFEGPSPAAELSEP